MYYAVSRGDFDGELLRSVPGRVLWDLLTRGRARSAAKYKRAIRQSVLGNERLSELNAWLKSTEQERDASDVSLAKVKKAREAEGVGGGGARERGGTEGGAGGS